MLLNFDGFRSAIGSLAAVIERSEDQAAMDGFGSHSTSRRPVRSH